MADLTISLLGTPTVMAYGTPLVLRRRQPLAILAYLALNPGPVPRSRLLLLLFPDCDEGLACQRLSRPLHDLRQALREANLADALNASSESIGLDYARCAVDALAFQAAAADPSAHALALDLYRGPLLDGFALAHTPEFDLWLEGERERLERLYHEALEASARTALDCGDPALAEQQARALVAADPLREHAHLLLIKALAAQGQRGAMLRQYDTLCELLRRELDVTPLPEVQAHYQALAASAAPPELPAQIAAAAAPTSVFVGRTEELRRVAAAVAVKPGVVHLLCISGSSGIGKSRLLAEGLGGASGVLLRLSCHATPPPGPYQALAEALTAQLPTATNPLAGRRASSDDEAQLWERLVQALIGLAGGGPLILAIDDAQWADQATLRALPYLARRLVAGGLLVALTCGDEQPQPLKECLGALARVAASQSWCELGPLDREAVAVLTTAWLGDAALADRFYNETEGNAFFLVETLRNLRERGGDPAALDEQPRSVRAAIEAHMARLPEGARRLGEVAAVGGRELELHLLRRVAGVGEADLVAGLEHMERAGVLVSTGGGYRFAHGKIGEALYAGLSLARRRQLHWRYAQALANTRRPGAPPPRLDHARRAHDWSLALEAARAAAADARRLAARADALAFEQAALEALDQLGGDPTDYVAVLLDCEEDAHRLGRRTEQAAVLERLARYASLAGAEDELLFRRARYLESLGRWGEAQPLLEQVAEVGPEPVRHAALLRLAHNRGRAGHFDDAITLARRAYDEAAAAPLRLEACLCLADIGQASEDYALATEWLNTAQPLARAAPERQPRLWELIARNELRRGGYERMLRYAERARAGYAARGDLIGQAGSRMLEGIAHSRLLRFDAAITAIAEAQATFRDAEDARGQAATTLNLAIQRYRLGDMAAARVGFAEARVGFAAINDRQGENVAVINQAIVAIAEQDFDTAERCAHLALAQAEALVQPLRQAMGWACLATTLLCRGDAAGAYAARERSLSLRPPDNNDRASELAHQALACLELGRRDEADALSRAALAQLQTFPHCEHPQRIYAIRALVAYRSGDEAAAYDALNIARRTLARVLSGLPSLADRRRFLDAIPANRFIRAAARGDWLSERPI